MAVEAHCSARMHVTAAKVRGPSPAPPNSVGTVRPSKPALPSAAVLSAGQRPARSTSSAWRRNTPAATSAARANHLSALLFTVLVSSCYGEPAVSAAGCGCSQRGFTRRLTLPVRLSQPVLGGGGHLAPRARAQGPERGQVDGVADEAHGAVGHRK